MKTRQKTYKNKNKNKNKNKTQHIWLVTKELKEKSNQFKIVLQIEGFIS